MVGWASGFVQGRVAKTESSQIQALHEGVDHSDRVLRADVFFQGFGEQDRLVAIGAFNVVHGDSSLDTWKR
jgi:hypothetical protein